jgi:hypothetical protein
VIVVNTLTSNCEGHSLCKLLKLVNYGKPKNAMQQLGKIMLITTTRKQLRELVLILIGTKTFFAFVRHFKIITSIYYELFTGTSY